MRINNRKREKGRRGESILDERVGDDISKPSVNACKLSRRLQVNIRETPRHLIIGPRLTSASVIDCLRSNWRPDGFEISRIRPVSVHGSISARDIAPRREIGETISKTADLLGRARSWTSIWETVRFSQDRSQIFSLSLILR